MNFTAIILAAGVSSRYKKNYSKFLDKINDISILDFSVNYFLNKSQINQIILVVNDSDYFTLKKRYEKIDIFVMKGGEIRQNSVFLSFQHVKNDFLFIHDAARPLISSDFVDDFIQHCKTQLVSTVGRRVTDTVHIFKDSKIVSTIDRSSLVEVYTPQGFNKSLIESAHIEAVNNNYVGTDDISLILKFTDISPNIYFVDQRNIKLTTSSDLNLLEVLINENR